MQTWIRKRFIPILLTIVCVAGFPSCKDDEQLNGVEQSKPPSVIMNTDQSSAPPVNTASVTRTLVYSGEEQAVVDVAVYDNTVYLLQDNGIQVFSNGIEGAFITLANDMDAELSPYCLAVSNDGLFVAYLDELNCVILLHHTFDGRFVQSYSSVGKVFATHVFDLAAQDGLAYISLWKSGSAASLYICDLATNTLTNTNAPAGGFCLNNDNQIIFANVSDYRATDYGIYDTKAEAYELVDTQLSYRFESFTFDVSNGRIYACGFELMSAFTQNRYSLGNFIAVIDLPNNEIARVAPVKDENGILAFAGKDLLLIENQNDLLVYSNPDGYRGKTHEPLQILYYADDLFDTNERSTAVFAAIHSEVQFELWERYNYFFLDVEFILQKIPRDSYGDATIGLSSPDKEYDLILFNIQSPALLNDVSGMVDLAENEMIYTSFMQMLPGIEELCTINGTLVGAPVYVMARGYAHNRSIPLAAGQKPLDFGWTIQDYYKYASAVGTDNPATLALPECFINPDDLISTVLSGRRLSIEDYVSYMYAYYTIHAETLYDTRNPMGMDLRTSFLNGIELSTTPVTRVNEASVVMEPRISENSCFPVGMGMLAVNRTAKQLTVALAYLQAFINPDVTYRAHAGTRFFTGFLTENAISCPIWYHSDELWEANSYLENYAFMLANSVTKRWLRDDRPRENTYMKSVGETIDAVKNNEMAPEDAAEKLFALQEEYLAGIAD